TTTTPGVLWGRDSAPGPNDYSQKSMSTMSSAGHHDTVLAHILTQEHNSLPSFLNAVFGFLSRHCPEEMYGSAHISGEHLISQSYCKWRQKYLDDKASQSLLPERWRRMCQ
ncbi:hypothetical protein OTU49_008052, partial [Cherax quadricarinatus]